MTAKKKRAGPGRPPMAGKAGRPVNVYLDDDNIDRARRMGEGCVSAGIRRALELSKSRTVA